MYRMLITAPPQPSQPGPEYPRCGPLPEWHACVLNGRQPSSFHRVALTTALQGHHACECLQAAALPPVRDCFRLRPSPCQPFLPVLEYSARIEPQ